MKRGKVTKWDDDLLDYGYVVHRRPDGEWWHLHFGRSGLEYFCDLLGRETTILAQIPRLAPWGISKSKDYILTFDGEGVEFPDEVLLLDFDWGQNPCNPKLQAEARSFQQVVMPLLFDNDDFQRAVAEIVHYGQHARMVAPAKFDCRPDACG